MGIQGLTLYHLKSHLQVNPQSAEKQMTFNVQKVTQIFSCLQKYRLSKNLHGQANCGSNKAGKKSYTYSSPISNMIFCVYIAYG